ncbi:hypothetical protein V496_09302 [Pseudogymnoascus sp. VKM F-4515 (FW-2607)]|nr:hypothetical protein V496_09302 [Pseudogymnoascus sp. VKM F-4515 (FW-2607)]
MVPFYGQGMNAGLEDVRVLFDLLPHSTPTPEALDRYTTLRAPDAAAISALALANYVEMREGVVSPLYKLRKRLEETLSHYFPALGWATQYSRVSFGNMRYSEVVEASRHQGNVILATGALVVPVIGVAVWMARGGVKCYTRAVLGMICGRVCGGRSFPTEYGPAFSARAVGDHKIPSTPTSSLRLVPPPAPSTHVAEGRATCQTPDEVRTSEYTGPPLEGVISEKRLVHPPLSHLRASHSRNPLFRECQVDVELAYKMRARASADNGADVDDLVE